MDPKEAIANDGWLRAARYMLIFAGVMYLLLIGVGPLIAAAKFKHGTDPAFDKGFGIGFSIVLGLVCATIAAANFVAAWALGQGKQWGWVLGVIIGGLYAPSICLPIGGVILYALIRDEGRLLYYPKVKAY